MIIAVSIILSFSARVSLHNTTINPLSLYPLFLPSHTILDGMITEDTGLGSLTNLGRFAGALPLDLNLGKLISYGIALGESVV